MNPIFYPVTTEQAGFADTPLPFSVATRFGDLLFVSGQASVDENGTIISGTFEEELRCSMEWMRRILEAAGTDFSRVVQVRAYVRDPANVPLYNQLYREYFSQPLPARTTLTGCLPETLHFEIDCIAVVPSTTP